MYDDGEYLQNILLKKLKPSANNNDNNNLKSHDVYFCYDMSWKIYNPWSKNKKKKKTLKTCYMMTWHVNPCQITLGLHNIHVKKI
jgi:hypothetical protein